MMLQLSKDSIDLGIVTTDAAASLAFYRDLLGLEDLGDGPMPGGHMYRLQCGTSMIKIIQPKRDPSGAAPAGGIVGATGYRYWTIQVSNIDEVVAACADAGRVVAVPVTELRPGTSMAIVEDPDGNWVEFIHRS